MKNKLRLAFYLIKHNFITILKFEIFYKMFTALIFLPAFNLLFYSNLKSNNLFIITLDNLSSLVNPYMIIFILVYLSIITIIEINTLIVIFDMSFQNKKLSFLNLIKLSIKKIKNIFNYKSILIVLFVSLLLPFINLGISSCIVSSITIPYFIIDYVNLNINNIIFIIVILLLITIILLRYIYSFHYMILEENNFKISRIKSKKMINQSRIKDILLLLLSQLFIYIIYMISIGIIIFILYKISPDISYNSILMIILFILSLIILFNKVFICSIISSLFYAHKIVKNKTIMNIRYNSVFFSTLSKIIINFLIIISITGFGLVTYYSFELIDNNLIIDLEEEKKLEITAHRGASDKYPENTMLAFIGAKELGTDYIELDVRKTLDNQIVVIHDSNLKRTTGIDKKVSDLTYDEIKEFDAGSFFSEDFKDERIPLLKDVIKYAKENDLKMNIEIKSSDENKSVESEVISLIKDYKYQNRCFISSFNYNILENIKEIDSNIKTIFVTSEIDDINNYEDADAFSIKYSNITKDLVDLIHNNNKKIHAWTIKDEEELKQIIDLSVDNIITNSLDVTKDIRMPDIKHYDLSILNEYINIINKK
ncbi:MAG: glycerophosphoryl diester phosphodiesterase membrane domain-containing protein [Bacilli bacterium]|nr:glycerophosphoryl diester phosphodiesterase membrane domain-containing protein [Bacilli bacterium]